MAKFKNESTHDVYIDLGSLLRVEPGQEVELPGARSVQGLTRVPDVAPLPKPKPRKKPIKKSKGSATSGTI